VELGQVRALFRKRLSRWCSYPEEVEDVIRVEVITQEQSDGYGRITMIWKIWRHWLIFFYIFFQLLISDFIRELEERWMYSSHCQPGKTTQECLQVKRGILMNDKKQIIGAV